MKKGKALTESERKFADENHNLIYSYMHSNRMRAEEYYDIVALGLLSAVRAYFEKPEIQKYAFSTIAYQYMRSKVSAARKGRHAGLFQEKDCELSYSAEVCGDSNEHYIDRFNSRDDSLESAEILGSILKVATPPQREIIGLRLAGYSQREIGEILGTGQVAVCRQLKDLKRKYDCENRL